MNYVTWKYVLTKIGQSKGLSAVPAYHNRAKLSMLTNACHACHLSGILSLYSRQIGGFQPIDVALGTSEKVLYPMWSSQPAKKEGKGGKEGPQFGLVVEIERRAAGGTPKVTLRSPLQVSAVIV